MLKLLKALDTAASILVAALMLPPLALAWLVEWLDRLGGRG